MTTPFGSNKIITHRINETELSTFFVGFDINDADEIEYRIDPLIDKLMEVLPEFAYGFHQDESTPNTEILSKLRDTAKSIYKIDHFESVKDIYLRGDSIPDEIDDKYLKRGEFGELILHLLLRDFHNTIPLISKIYFKDSFGTAVHGFDAVHIQPDTKTLWLGESKIYQDGKSGIRSLVGDIFDHFKKDYLDAEFLIISKKIKLFDNIPEKDYWINLISGTTKLKDQLDTINIPLLCTYNSDLFTKHSDEETAEFIAEYDKEMREMKKYFDYKNDHSLKSRLNIILLLFPIQDKVELIKGLHQKLSLMQQL